MSFDSFSFAVFFLIVLLLHRLPISWRLRKLNLLIASYLFYMAWNPPFVVLLWISTLVDWFIGKWLGSTQSTKLRKLLLLGSLVVNLGMLSYFKYANFILDKLHCNGGERWGRLRTAATGHRSARRHFVLHVPNDFPTHLTFTAAKRSFVSRFWITRCL